MNIRDEINKIIVTNCYTEEDKPEDSVIMGEDFSKLAEDLVKFCNLHFVSQRSEQLVAYTEWLKKEGLLNATVSKLIVKKYQSK